MTREKEIKERLTIERMKRNVFLSAFTTEVFHFSKKKKVLLISIPSKVEALGNIKRCPQLVSGNIESTKVTTTIINVSS